MFYYFTDIDECNAFPSSCPIYANCENILGSYHCSRRPGFLAMVQLVTDIWVWIFGYLGFKTD